MRTVPLASAIAVVVVGLAGAGSFAAVSQASVPSPAKSQTLVFNVVFSPLQQIAANNVRNPAFPVALGDEIVEHDQLFSQGQHVGDYAGRRGHVGTGIDRQLVGPIRKTAPGEGGGDQ